jgi:hypothetical protein
VSEWSLEKEICELAGASDFRHALHQLNLLPGRDVPFDIEEDDEWTRGGSETYIYRFWINFEGRRAGYIIKCCVAFSPVCSLEEIFDEWVVRRQLISSRGVSTPLLIAHGKATLIEELVPHRFQDRLVQSSERHKLLKSLATWAGVLARFGFAPLGPFDDLRSRGNDLVVIDFGEDLGPLNIGTNPFELYERMLGYLGSFKVVLSESQMAELYDIYISCLEIS